MTACASASSPSGRAETVVGVLGRDGLSEQRLRVGQADILDGHAHQAAGDVERILAAVEHARKPIERRIGVRAAHRFVQRADQVVVAVLRTCRRAARAAAAASTSAGAVERRLGAGRRGEHNPRPGDARRGRRRRPWRRALRAPRRSSGSLRFSCGLGALEQRLKRRVVEPLEHQHAGARQKRRVELEGRVLGGGADQDDGAVLDVRQEAVLLGAVEAVDLVDEQQRALAAARARRAPPRRLCAGRRRRRRSPRAARNADRSPRPAGARPWSCRCPAAPRGSPSRACRPPACGSACPRAPSR